MIDTIVFDGKHYPKLQSEGNAAQYAAPFANKLCTGIGYDIGYNREEWKLKGAIGVDEIQNTEYHATNLPALTVDFIHSSHMLEHYKGRFQDVIEYWLTKLNENGIIFLYLPNCDYQKYWAWGNKKHIHYLSPSIMRDYCEHLKGIRGFFVTDGYDLNGSFYCVIYK